MKKIVFLALALALVVGWGSKDKGELTGVKGKRWHPEKSYGMSLIPGGAFIMGKSDDDIVDLQDAPTRTVTGRSFDMDETEITNIEDRQCV
jgi:formylglycine-generating enzyme required for sulfatase activity